MSLSKYKAGKFAPTCKHCQTKFQLLIQQKQDGSFAAKTALFPAAPIQPKESDKDTKLDETRPTSVPQDSQTANLDETRPTAVPQEPSHANLDETRAASSTRANRSQPTLAPANANRFDSAPDSLQTGRDEPALGSNLGPYRLLKLLGQGGMGSVFLAKQTSLDRNVALKVIKTKLAERPSMMARFTREAYAAAQLVHPNVVQIYDMGDDRGNCFFSMELVQGHSLSDVVSGEKKVDPEQAASFILHAARGLQCAHNAGMVHRDIKPANLLVDANGIVKVADLGLVKVPDQEEIEDESENQEMAALSASKELTRFGTAIGTPYYMAPEQAKNSVTVDHRADIYSLGCTFYVLLTGKRPFDGKSFQEVVSKHTSEPLVMPTKIVARVPELLSGIVGKMMAKKPGDRYQTTGELITELEKFLGLSSTAAFTPDEQDADMLEENATAFNGIPLAKLRSLLPLALIAGSFLFAVVMLFVNWRWGLGFVILPFAAVLSYFFFGGLRENSNLFSKTREVVFRSGVVNWLKWMGAAVLLMLAVFLTGLWIPVLMLGLVGVGMGVGYYYFVDKPIQQQRKSTIQETESLLRKMRLKGLEENAIQTFVAKYAGKHWEEFFEQIFGYAAKRRVRDKLKQTETGKTRPKFWAWRDRLNDGLDSRLKPLVEANDRQHLQKVELAGLQAAGVSAVEAKEQAAQMAAALVDHGDSIRVAALEQRIADLSPEAQRLKQRLKIKQMLNEAREGKYRKSKSPLEQISPLLNSALGSYTRFLLGCLLVVGSLMWARQNGLLEAVKQSAAQAQQAITNNDLAGAQDATKEQMAKLGETLNRDFKPLNWPVVGSLFFQNFNALIAGLILLCSALTFGWRMSLFAIPAALIAIWGAAIGIPNVFPIRSLDALSALIGVAIFCVGIMLGRTEK